MTSSPFLWGVFVGGLIAWFGFRPCPGCGRRGIDPGAILAHGAQSA